MNRQRSRNDATSGYLSHTVLPLYFGLGDATRIDKVEVRWPSGKKQEIEKDVKPNDLLKVKEETGEKSTS